MRGWVFEGPVHETLSEFVENVQSPQCSGYNVSKCVCLYPHSVGGVGYYCRPTQQLLFPSSWSYLNTAGNSIYQLQTSIQLRDNCQLDFLYFLLRELKLATTASLSPFLIKYSWFPRTDWRLHESFPHKIMKLFHIIQCSIRVKWPHVPTHANWHHWRKILIRDPTGPYWPTINTTKTRRTRGHYLPR
jgi:hypothetical protein